MSKPSSKKDNKILAVYEGLSETEKAKINQQFKLQVMQEDDVDLKNRK